MFAFWLSAALLLLIPLSVIIITLLKTHEDNDSNQNASADLYKQRLMELESDITNGILSEADAESVKEELQLSLLNQDKNKQRTATKIKSTSSTITAVSLLILVPVFVIALYQAIGQPHLIMHASLLSEFNQAETDEEKLASIEKMLTQLEQRLINKPDDVDGWLMLTNSYTSLERYPDALRAIDNLYRLKADDPTVMLRYADILSMVNDGDFTGKPTTLINKALELDPENSNGLWLAGLAANERGDITSAIAYWQRLIPKLEEDSEPQQQIKQYIQLASEHLNSVQNNIETTAEPVAESRTPAQANTITINVSLADTLLNEMSADDTLFVYARAIEGPPIPLAIVRQTASALPLQVTLDDSMAMMPSNKLSDHTAVQVIARLSKSGDAKPESGDLIGTIESVSTSESDIINLIISNKIP